MLAEARAVSSEYYPDGLAFLFALKARAAGFFVR